MFYEGAQELMAFICTVLYGPEKENLLTFQRVPRLLALGEVLALLCSG